MALEDLTPEKLALIERRRRQLQQPPTPQRGVRSLPPVSAPMADSSPVVGPQGVSPQLPQARDVMVGARTHASTGSISDLFAHRAALQESAQDYPSAKVSHTDRGYDIAPPQKPSRLKAFLRGLGGGAAYGAQYGLGGAIGGAAAGGIAGAIKPEYIDKIDKRLQVEDLDRQINTGLGFETKAANIRHEDAQTAAARSNADIAARYPNTHARNVLLPNGAQGTTEQNGQGGWDIMGIGADNVPAVGPVPKTYSVKVGGQTIEGLTPPQAATAINTRSGRELDERQFVFQQRKDEADRVTKQAEAAVEAESWDEALNFATSASQIHRGNAQTQRDYANTLNDEIANEADETRRSILVQRRKEANDQAVAAEKAAQDIEDKIPDMKVKAGGARGRMKAPTKLNPPSSGIFNRYP